MTACLRAWITAGLVLAVFPSFATPPLGCLEDSRGRRWCDHDQPKSERYQKTETIDENYVPWVHPDTVKRDSYPPISGVGPQVKPIDAAKLLPHRPLKNGGEK